MMGGWLLYASYRYLLVRWLKGRAAAVAFTAVLSIAMFYPFLTAAYDSLSQKSFGGSIKGDIQDTMLWLRDNTPRPDDPYAPWRKPPYSVMARWDYAGWIEYIAERPVVATLFGTETYGYNEAMAFYASELEASANAVMDKTGARYVIVSGIFRPLEKVAMRLQVSDGMDVKTDRAHIRGVDHYRLLHESAKRIDAPWFPEEIKVIKVFEYVPGATLKAAARKGQEVSVVSRVRTNRGRTFDFVKKGVAGPDGFVDLILPYSPAKEGGTGLILPYRVIFEGKEAAIVEVSEEDVIGGRQIAISIR
jgi:asparagine N-glycosylation enzyme membrane subunit Stt3